MVNISLNMTETFGLAVLVLLFGKLMVSKIGFLYKFCIPAPVVGGITFSLLTLLGHQTGLLDLKLDTTLQSFFMVLFFTSVGFSASIDVLKKGGVAVGIFLAAAAVLCAVQSGIGVAIATALGESPLLGLAAGSVSMTGGHGTSGAFGPLLEKAGLTAATTIAMAAATFGLVSGSLLGGPTGRRLIEKYKLTSSELEGGADADEHELLKQHKIPLDNGHLATGFFQLAIAVGIGSVLSGWIKDLGVTLPVYVGAMLVAAALRNIFKDGTKYETRLLEIQALGEIFLGVFLAMALMSMKLWQLADLALPLTCILVAQVAMMYVYATYVTFNVMGRDFDAAVISAGHCGFGLGATPNGVANMTAVVQKYGPSTKAFFVLPIIGGLFIDFFNALIITGYLNFLGV